MISNDTYQFLSRFCAGPIPGDQLPRADFKRALGFCKSGFLSSRCSRFHAGPYYDRVFEITVAGEEAMSRFDDRHKEQAEAKRQHDEQIAKADKDRKEQLKHDWRIAIFSAVFGLISGLIAEHFLDILTLLFGP